MKKNIFTENQIAAIALSLAKSVSPLKYAYITEEGSQAWDNIEKQRAQQGGNYAEYELLQDNIDMYLQDIGHPQEVCFFDFGCGTGNTVKGMLKKIIMEGTIVHYHGFDISENIIALAEKNIGNLGDNYSFDATILDFETFNLANTLIEIRKKYNNVPVIALMLGNTIGNFDSIERIIINIMEALRIEDRMIIGIEKTDINNEKRMQDMIQGYQASEAFQLSFSTLKYFHIKENQGNYKVVFNAEKNIIEGFFLINKDLILEIAEKKIHFEKGDKIKLFQSKKMHESSLAQLLLSLDLRIASTRTNLKDTFIQTMVGAKKY